MWDRAGFPMSGVLASILPFACAVLAAIVANFPVSFTGGAVPGPMLALMPVYFWALVRPDLMPPAAAFAIGILEDLFSGGPPGVWALAFVATYAVIDRERDAFAGLSGFWAILGFGAAMLLTAAVAYLVTALDLSRLPPVTPVAMQSAITILFYVPGAMFLGWAHRRLVGPLRGAI